jgi:hypothetical protein
VFGDEAGLLNSLCRDTRFNEPGIDPLFVAAPGIATNPWDTAKVLRLGQGLENLNWRVVSPREAEYSEPINRDLDGPQAIVTKFRTAKALLVYRRDPL